MHVLKQSFIIDTVKKKNNLIALWFSRNLFNVFELISMPQDSGVLLST